MSSDCAVAGLAAVGFLSESLTVGPFARRSGANKSRRVFATTTRADRPAQGGFRGRTLVVLDEGIFTKRHRRL